MLAGDRLPCAGSWESPELTLGTERCQRPGRGRDLPQRPGNMLSTVKSWYHCTESTGKRVGPHDPDQGLESRTGLGQYLGLWPLAGGYQVWGAGGQSLSQVSLG